MVDISLALNLLQLVALSLPAFAILLEMIVESDFPYANEAVPVIVASFGAFILAGVLTVVSLIPTTEGTLLSASLVLIVVGFVLMGIGIGLVGMRTRREQNRRSD